MHYIVRDFDRQRFEARKQFMITSAETWEKGGIRNHPHIIELARQALVDYDVELVIKPIRGSTNGAQFSWRGLPCKNLLTGGYYITYHGKHEFASQDVMEKAVQVITRLAALTVSGSLNVRRRRAGEISF